MVTNKFFLVAKKEVKFDPCSGCVLWQDTLEPKPGVSFAGTWNKINILVAHVIIVSHLKLKL